MKEHISINELMSVLFHVQGKPKFTCFECKQEISAAPRSKTQTRLYGPARRNAYITYSEKNKPIGRCYHCALRAAKQFRPLMDSELKVLCVAGDRSTPMVQAAILLLKKRTNGGTKA